MKMAPPNPRLPDYDPATAGQLASHHFTERVRRVSEGVVIVRRNRLVMRTSTGEAPVQLEPPVAPWDRDPDP